MNVKLVAFGVARDILNAREVDMSVNAIDNIGDLKQFLMENYPGFAQLRSFRMAVNEEYQDDDFQINDRDEIMIIPPVSGG